MTGDDPGRVPVRLALLDDHEIILDSLASWIQANAPEFDVVLRAGSWVDLVHSPAFPAQLVIMDLQLAETVSIEARVRTCRAAGARVIILSAIDTPTDRERARAAGAAAFVSKSAPMRQLIATAREVMGLDGQAEPVREWRPLPAGAAEQPKPSLSSGEREALVLYVNGATTAQVAARMNVQYETAKTYLRRVREKYGKVGRPTSTRADLIRRAAEDGYLV